MKILKNIIVVGIAGIILLSSGNILADYRAYVRNRTSGPVKIHFATYNDESLIGKIKGSFCSLRAHRIAPGRDPVKSSIQWTSPKLCVDYRAFMFQPDSMFEFECP